MPFDQGIDTVTDFYPDANYRPTNLLSQLRSRPDTWAITEHETYGLSAAEYAKGRSSLGGDESVFMNTYPVHFYVLRTGAVRQYAPLSRVTYHAYSPANELAVSIEHEGCNEIAWTPEQFDASAKLNAWLLDKYGLPCIHAAHPREGVRSTWLGMLSHADLSYAHIGGSQQTHTDDIPDAIGWPAFLAAVAKGGAPTPLPDGNTLRLFVEGHPVFAGWDEAKGPLINISRNGLKPTTATWIAWQHHSWKGATDVTNVAKHLVNQFNLD